MGILKETIQEFIGDECPRMAAALSYYTVFSLPAALLLVMFAARPFVEIAAVRSTIEANVARVVGPGVAEQVGAILENVGGPGGGPVGIVFGAVALLFAATASFAQLQAALNRAWSVEPDPERGHVRNFLVKRAFSFLMLLGVATLLLASMLANTLLAGFGRFVGAFLPESWSGLAFALINVTLSYLVATFVFALMFQVLPDARVRWAEALIGALATALLFLLGNFGLGFYLARSDPGSAFGAAGSLAVLIIWVYYSAMIFFLGAEMTQVITHRRGGRIRPIRGAVRVVHERRIIRED